MTDKMIRRVVPAGGTYGAASELKELFGGRAVVSGRPEDPDKPENQSWGADFLRGKEMTPDEMKDAIEGSGFVGSQVSVEFVQTEEMIL
jgi:hypothetical protein